MIGGFAVFFLRFQVLEHEGDFRVAAQFGDEGLVVEVSQPRAYLVQVGGEFVGEQDVPEGASCLKKRGVPGVQDIEHAIGENEFLVLPESWKNLEQVLDALDLRCCWPWLRNDVPPSRGHTLR